ncbi:Uncharacterised protein [Chlamydia trachomatis]|nr:Uncharacterised protein [Chlamydia trachomatis]
MPVVAAGKFHDQVATGCSACQTHGGHGGFSAGGDETDTLGGAHPAADQFGEFNFRLGRRTKRQAFRCRLLNGFDDCWVRVSQQCGSPRTHQVHVFAPSRVLHICALRGCDERRDATDGSVRAHGRINSAGNHP